MCFSSGRSTFERVSSSFEQRLTEQLWFYSGGMTFFAVITETNILMKENLKYLGFVRRWILTHITCLQTC